METKKINRLMLGIFLFHIVVVAILTIAAGRIQMGVILSLSLGEIILLTPALVYLLFYKLRKPKAVTVEKDVYNEDGIYYEEQETQICVAKKESLRERLHYNKVKPSTLAYVLFFTWLSMPLTTLINAISMLFVDNTIVAMTDVILTVPFLLMLFLMAVLPATVEELVFRGIAYGGYRKSGTKFMAVMLSALMFGLMHMNLNQALYAFVIGILLALLFEATNSIFTTMLFHFIYNAQSCCMMFLVEAIMPGYYQDAANVALGQEELFMTISVYLIIAAVTTPLAFCMLYKIAKNEGRTKELKECLPKKQQGKERLVTISFILAVIVAVAYIIYDIVMSMMM